MLQPPPLPPLLRTTSNLPKILLKNIPQSLTYQVVIAVFSLYDFQCCYNINRFWLVNRSTSRNTHCVKSVRNRSFSDPYFTRNSSEYGMMWTISPYSIRMQENKDQKSSEYRYLTRSDTKHNNHKNARTNGLLRHFSVAFHKSYSFLSCIDSSFKYIYDFH